MPIWAQGNRTALRQKDYVALPGPPSLSTVTDAPRDDEYQHHTDFREGQRVDRNGNVYRYVGRALIMEHRRELRRKVFDVLLSASPQG